jgi:hypothetical protein
MARINALFVLLAAAIALFVGGVLLYGSFAA